MKLFGKNDEIKWPSSIKAVEERDTLRIMRLTGSIDAGAVEEIQRVMPRIRESKSFVPKNLILDFKNMFDPSGL